MLKKIVIALSLILWPLNIFLNFKNLSFSTETVFKNDYQGEQLVLRNIHLYPSPIFARIFQNKPRIYINKYIENLFTLIDPNYYFFASHPEPISGALNLHKYPFPDLIFLIVGIYYISKSKYKKMILITLIPSILILSALKNFEGFSIVLYLPVSLLIINGINLLQNKNKKLFTALCFIFILYAVPEVIRAFFVR